MNTQRVSIGHPYAGQSNVSPTPDRVPISEVKIPHNVDAFNPDKVSKKKTLKLEIDVWPDGSGDAKVNDVQLSQFIRVVDSSPASRKGIVKMLRQAADVVEAGVL